MSWTEAGVLAVATYAEKIKQKSHDTPQFHTSSGTVGKILIFVKKGLPTMVILATIVMGFYSSHVRFRCACQ